METANRTESPEETKRLAIITLVCVIGFITTILVLQIAFSSILEDGGWYPNYLTLSTLLSLVCLVGIWKMKRWAVFAYTILAVSNQIISFMAETWDLTALIVPALIVISSLANVKKMSGSSNSWMVGSLAGVVAIALLYFFVVQPGVEINAQRTAELEQRLRELEEKDDDGNTENFLAAAISLREAARQVNEASPLIVDSETRLDGAEVLPNNTFRYNYTLVNVTKAQIDTLDARRQLEPDMIHVLRTNVGAQVFRDHKTTVVYRYHDKNDAYAFNVTVTPEMYSLLNMPVQTNN